MKKFKIARSWTFIYAIILSVSVALIFALSIGGNNLRYRGNTVTINKNSDYRLYKVDSKHALYVTPGNQDVSLITYEKEDIFRFLGEYRYDKEVFPQVCRNGNWLYTDNAGFAHPGRPIAYNYKSGEMLKKAEPVKEQLGYTPANLAAAGLECHPKFRLTPQNIAEFKELDMPRESSITVTLALVIIHILWALALPFAIKKVKI